MLKPGAITYKKRYREIRQEIKRILYFCYMTSTSIRPVMALLMICLGTSLVSFAQKNSTQQKGFDSIYYYVATTLSATHIDQAIRQADSLLVQSADSLQKLRSLMLLATLKKRTGQSADALALAMQGEALAGKTGNDEWRLRISGFLSTTFRELGLTTEGKKYIGIAETLSKTKLDAPLMKLFIHQEKAYYAIDDLRYGDALQEITAAMKLVPAPLGAGAQHSIPVATCYQLAGFCYIRLDSLVQAGNYLHQALELLGDQETELKGFIYHNLGELALRQKAYPQAKRYLDSATAYINTSGNFNLKLYTYKTLQDYYSAKGGHDKALQFQSQYTELLQQQAALTNRVSDQLIEKFGNELKQKTTDNYILYSLCVGLVIILVLSVLYTLRVRKREREKYLAYLDKLNARKPVNVIPLFAGIVTEEEPDSLVQKAEKEPEIMEPHTEPRKGLVIPKETEQRLLHGLARVEAEQLYLGKDVTLPYIASILKTNTKYLSATINKHKEKDFNGYINEWRINYIVDKLRQDKDYQQYKISHLAEECGFSTHSKFAAAFKQVTGVSPSSFIENLKKDQRK